MGHRPPDGGACWRRRVFRRVHEGRRRSAGVRSRSNPTSTRSTSSPLRSQQRDTTSSTYRESTGLPRGRQQDVELACKANGGGPVSGTAMLQRDVLLEKFDVPIGDPVGSWVKTDAPGTYGLRRGYRCASDRLGCAMAAPLLG